MDLGEGMVGALGWDWDGVGRVRGGWGWGWDGGGDGDVGRGVEVRGRGARIGVCDVGLVDGVMRMVESEVGLWGGVVGGDC